MRMEIRFLCTALGVYCVGLYQLDRVMKDAYCWHSRTHVSTQYKGSSRHARNQGILATPEFARIGKDTPRAQATRGCVCH